MQTKTATITLNGDLKKIFPLFGAYEEKKWAKGWNPTPVYPRTEKIEEGATFKTPGHLPGENEYIWRVSKFDEPNHLIQYMVYGPDRCWTITVQCAATANQTTATITYTFIPLNPAGEEKSRHSLHHLFQHDLKDWEDEINGYLSR
jgi:hypothetical protein